MAKGHRQDSKTRVQYAVRGACDDPDCGDPSGDNGLQRGTNSSARLDDESADTRHSSSTKISSQTTSVASPQYQLSASVVKKEMAKGRRPDSKTRVQYAGRVACDGSDYGHPSGENGLQRGTNSSARLDDGSADTRHSSTTKTRNDTTFLTSLQKLLPDSTRVFDEGASNQNDLHTDTPDDVIGATCEELTDSYQCIHPSSSDFEDTDLVEEDFNARKIECRSSQKAVCARNPYDIHKITALGKSKHKERFERRSTCTDFCIHPSKKHDHHQHYDREGDVFEQCCNKVGLVQCVQCGDLGTCFRIGACQCWTCNHVVKKCEARQHHLEMIFFNQGPKRDATRKFQIKLAFRDQRKDCVCYDLQDNGYDFPPAFEYFREVLDEESLVYLVAFQKDRNNSQLRVYSDVVLLQPFSEDRIKQLNVDVMERYPHVAEPLPFPHGPFKGENGCVPMLCPLVYGASGGIAVTFDESDKLTAVCMYRQGYPEQYYPSFGTKTSLTAEERDRFPACWKAEMGLSVVNMRKGFTENNILKTNIRFH